MKMRIVGSCFFAVCFLAGCGANGAHELSYVEETGILDAAMNGKPESVRTWIEGGARLTERDEDGMTPLLLAADRGHTEAVHVLLDCGARIEDRDHDLATALHKAAAMGDLETATLLLAHGANPMALDKMGNTPLHLAAEMRNFEMAGMQRAMGMRSNYEWKEQNVEVARSLLAKGADVNARNSFGRTPLQRTTPWNFLPMAKLLLENGADKTIADHEGKTPLDHARASDSKDVMKLLQ